MTDQHQVYGEAVAQEGGDPLDGFSNVDVPTGFPPDAEEQVGESFHRSDRAGTYDGFDQQICWAIYHRTRLRRRPLAAGAPTGRESPHGIGGRRERGPGSTPSGYASR